MLTLILVLGTGGYVLLGLDLFNAVYQTVITIVTVGYREIGDVGRRYQVFGRSRRSYGGPASAS